MKSIDSLEHGGAGQTVAKIRHLGYELPLDDPRERNYQWVLMALGLRALPSLPHDLPQWKYDLAFDHWAAAWDLPSFADARRLAYLVDHYRGPLTNDLLIHAGLDLGEEWRARRWTRLLDVIDRLPGHSHYAAAVANDEEHAELVAKALEERKQSGDTEDIGPSLTNWTPEVAALTAVLDAVNQVRYAVVAVNAGKKAGEPPKPAKRPVTALEKASRRAEHRRRQSAHESLTARLLPRKAAVKS